MFFELDANGESFVFLKKINQKCEWMWQIYLKYVLGGFVVSVISMASISVIICFIVKGEFDEGSAYHPFKFM